MPDLPPVTEDFRADSAQYVDALLRMAEVAQKAADAQDKLVAGIRAMQEAMDQAAAGASEAAAAEADMGKAAAGAAGAENAAAGATANLGKAAVTAAGFLRALSAQERLALTTQAGMERTSRMLADALDAVGLAEQFVDEAAGKANEALAAGSLYAAQGVANARALAGADVALTQAQNVAADAARTHAAAEEFLATAFTHAERDALGLTGVLAATTAANRAAADSAANTGRVWAANIGWFRVTGNALHWIVAGAVEFLAVAVPAAIAFGAGLAVAAQGAQNAYIHLSALYQATESTYAAFHKTTGDVLGLGHALQTAQNAANPGVYTILGSAINDIKSSFGGLAQAGLQVVRMFDEFAARVTVDLKTGMGTQIQGLLSGMVHDLQQFGQVLGNLGHALLNFASAMPGLAHVLLTIAVYLSSVVEVASRFGTIILFGMALEEMYRWGGLVLTMLVRLTGQMAVMNAMGAGNFITRFGAALLTLVTAGGRALIWAGQMVGRLAGVSAAFGTLGTAMAGAGSEAALFAESMSPAMAAGIIGVAAAVVFLVAKLASMKDATQQWVASSDALVAKASDLNVLPTIYGQLAETTTKLAASQGTLATQVGIVDARFATGRPAWQGASTDSQALAGHLMSLVTTADTVRANIGLLAGAFHTSAIGALALANAAGINLQAGMARGSVGLRIAEQQITNLKTGLGAMSAPIGVIGADMEALGVQSQLASSKVGQVNQALDSFVATTTGGMSTLAQFEGALRQMGSDAVSSSVGIDGAIRSISRDAAHMGYTLQGMGPKAQQSWQQFASATQQANSVLDIMRIGMAEGVVSSGQYGTAVRAAAGQLLPFAAHSRTAVAIVSQLAQEAGFPATTSLKTLAAQVGVTGAKAKGELVPAVEAAIARMANLNTVARNLSATVSGQLDSAMASAIVKASGLDAAYTKWATDVKTNAAPATLKADLAAIAKAQNFVNTAQAKATTVLNDNATAAKSYGTALKGASTSAGTLGDTVKKVTDLFAAHSTMARNAATATQGYSTQAHDAAGTSQGLSTQAMQANTAVKALGVSAGNTRAALGTVNNEIRNTATAAGNARGPLGTMSNEIINVGSNAASAAGQVSALATAIAGLQSKTITITTNMVTTVSQRAGGGPVAPNVPYLVGEAGREIFVPSQAGTIIPAPATERIMSGASGAAGDGRPIIIHLEHTTNLEARVDQGVLFEASKTSAAVYNLRTNGNPSAGVLAPRTH